MNKPLFLTQIWTSAVKAVLVILAVLVVATTVASFTTQPSHALSGKDFKAGNIIDDYTFYNKSSMNATQIQNFLNAKVPSCDTYGTQSASAFGYPNKTRAQYAAMVGWQKPPYTCLRNYKQANVPQMEAASGLCNAISAKTNRTAAQIIKDVSDACGVNPQVLLVLLEKEQSLITDTWPLSRQYEKATGFACPDTAPCDSSYGGFYYQMYYAARQYKIYRAYPDNYNYIAGRNNRIYYNPNYSCGSSNVYIENQATAGLYNYTPYQPNASALNNLYGSGDSCGAYGNRNFWRLFSGWFGGTHGGITINDISFESQPFTNKKTYAKITMKNISRATAYLGRMKIEARGPNNAFYQTPSVSNISIKPGATLTFRQPITIAEEGNFTFAVARNSNDTWLSPPFSDFTITDDTKTTIAVTKEPTIDQSLSLPQGTQHVGAPITATFRIKNNSTVHSINVGRLKIQGTTGSYQYDFPSTVSNLSIPAGQTYTYSQQFTPTRAGTYSFKIMNYRNGYRWSDSFPASANVNISRTASVKVNDSVTLIQPLQLSRTSAHQGEEVTATFTMKNFSQSAVNVGRMKVEGKVNNTQFDFASTPDDLVLQPGEEFVYSKSGTFNRSGDFSFKIMNYRDGYRWNGNYPMSESSTITRTAHLSIKDPVTLTSGLSLSTSSPRSGDTILATFTMKNFSNKAVNVGRMKVEGKVGKTQYDLPSTPDNLTLQPGEEYTYSKSLKLSKVGAYNFRIVNYRNDAGWRDNYPVSETSTIPRSANLTVRHAVTITQGLSLSAATASPTTPVTASFTIKNFSSVEANIGRMKVEGKIDGIQYEFPSTPDNLILQPGQEYIYSKTRTLPRIGTYNLGLSNYRSWAGWSFEYPYTETSAIPRTASIVIK